MKESVLSGGSKSPDQILKENSKHAHIPKNFNEGDGSVQVKPGPALDET